MENKKNIETRAERKSLSAKQVFRTIVFEYHFDKVIPIELLAQVTADMTYPLAEESIKIKYKAILTKLLGQYCNHEKHISEDQFCIFYGELQKHGHEDYIKKISERLFRRYAHNEVLDEKDFARLVANFGLNAEEAKVSFYSLADLKNEITYKKFMDYTVIYKV